MRRRRRRRWAHTPVIHAASHFDMKKELHGFLLSMNVRDSPFCIGMGLRSATLRAAGAPLKIVRFRTKYAIPRQIKFTVLNLTISRG